MSDAIREILSTFELPKFTEEFLFFRISRDQRYLSLNSYSDKYRHITNLVYAYKSDPIIRRAISLDAPLEKSSKRTMHEILAEDNDSYERLEGMSLYKATDLAFSFLDKKQREIILKLREKSNNNQTNLQTLDILAEFLLIGERTTVFAKLMEQDKRFRHPEKRIVHVNLDPENPWIRWGNRNYNGRPIDYFNRHKDVYGGKSRNELSEFDSGLYYSLLKNVITLEDGRTVKQLHLAIPEKQQREYHGNPLEFFMANKKNMKECQGGNFNLQIEHYMLHF